MVKINFLVVARCSSGYREYVDDSFTSGKLLWIVCIALLQLVKSRNHRIEADIEN